MGVKKTLLSLGILSILSILCLNLVSAEVGNSYQVPISIFGGYTIDQIEMDDSFPCAFSESVKAVVCSASAVNISSLGINQSDYSEFKEGKKSKEEIMSDYVVDKLKYDTSKEKAKKDLIGLVSEVEDQNFYAYDSDKISDFLEYGVPVIDNRINDTENKKYWNYLGSDYVYQIDTTLGDGQVKIGLGTNTFNITNFNYGDAQNVLVDSVYGVELANGVQPANSSGLVFNMVVNNQTVYDSVSGSLCSKQGVGNPIYFNYLTKTDISGAYYLCTFNQQREQNFSLGCWYNLAYMESSSNDAFIFLTNVTSSSTVLKLMLGVSASKNELIGQYSTIIGGSQSTDSIDNSYTDGREWNLGILTYTTTGNSTNGTGVIYFNNQLINSTIQINGSMNGTRNIYIASGWNGSVYGCFVKNYTISGQEVDEIYSRGVFRNNTKPDDANWTSAIQTREAGQFHQFINVSVFGSNFTTNDNYTIKTRTGQNAVPDLSDPNLVMWLKFDNDASKGENSNNFYNEYSNLLISFTNSGAFPTTTYGSYNSGNATKFNSINQNLENYTYFSGNVTNFSIITNFKISSGYTTNYNIITAVRNSSNTARLRIDISNSNIIRCRIDTDEQSNQVLQSTNQLRDNAWHSVLLTYTTINSTASNITLSIDGATASSKIINGTIGNMYGLNIGGSSGTWWNGSIDNYVLYNRTLSPSEVLTWSDWSLAQYTNDNSAIKVTQNASDTAMQVMLLFNSNLNNVSARATQVSILNNYFPVLNGLKVNATTQYNRTQDNLTAYYSSVTDNDNDTLKVIYQWYDNGEPIEILNLEMEGNVNSTYVRDYSSNNFSAFITQSSLGTISYCSTCGNDGRGAYTIVGNTTSGRIKVKTIPSYNSNLNLNQPNMTFCIMAKSDGSTGTDQYLFSQQVNSTPCGGSTRLYAYLRSNTSVLGIRIGNMSYSSDDVYVGDNNQNKWKQYCITMSSDNKVRYSINGVYNSIGVDYYYNNTCNSFFDVGSLIGGSSFNGTIAWFKIWNTTLTAQQQLAIYNNQSILTSQETETGHTYTVQSFVNDGYTDSVGVNDSIYIPLSVNNLSLISPSTNTSLVGDEITFKFSIDQNVTIMSYCNLTLDNSNYPFTGTLLTDGSTNTQIVNSVGGGNHRWYYNCTDTEGVITDSEIRIFSTPLFSGTGSGVAGGPSVITLIGENLTLNVTLLEPYSTIYEIDEDIIWSINLTKGQEAYLDAEKVYMQIITEDGYEYEIKDMQRVSESSVYTISTSLPEGKYTSFFLVTEPELGGTELSFSVVENPTLSKLLDYTNNDYVKGILIGVLVLIVLGIICIIVWVIKKVSTR